MNRILVLLLFSFFPLLMHGQQYPLRLFLQDEIAGSEILTIAQGNNGVLWLGLSDGLASFDGWALHRHPIDIQEGVTALLPAPAGGLWIGTSGGRLGQLLNGKITWQDTIEAPGSRIIALLPAGDSLLVVTSTEGLLCFSRNNWIRLSIHEYQPGRSLYGAVLSGNGMLWLAGEQGVFSYKISSGDSRHYTGADGLPDLLCTAIAINDTGRLWVGTFDSGIASFDAEMDAFVPLLENPWRAGAVTAILQQSDHVLWCTTEGSGLLQWHPTRPDTMVPVQDQPAISLRKTRLLFADREGSIWTSGEGGLLSIRPSVSIFQQPTGEEATDILTVHTGISGRVYLATNTGVYVNESGNQSTWHTLNIRGMRPDDVVVTMQEDAEGYLWLGTFGQGLLRVDSDGAALRLTEQDGLVNNNVLDLACQGDTLWMATLGGAGYLPLRGKLRRSDYTFVNYTTEDGLGTNYIYQVYPDSKGRVWFATDGKGLSVLDKGKLRRFDKSQGISSEVVYSITEDRQGHIWFSALHAGIYRYDGSTFRQFSEKDGLHGIDIVALSCTDEGQLVIVHEEGIDLLDTRSLQIIHLEDEIGLLKTNTNLNVLDKGASGEVWIGLQNGLLRYKVANNRQAFQPMLSIREMLIDRRPAELRQFMKLSHRQNHLTFLYDGIWFSGPQMVQYQHRLEGFDDSWVTTRDRQVSYPGLPPGEYTFTVRCSVDGIFDEEETVSVAFVILPPFWQTWWFISLTAIILVLGIYLYVTFREKRIRKWQQLEQDKVEFQFQTLRSQVNPHFLFNSFNTLLTMIEGDSKQAAAYVQTLSDFFRDILSYRDVDLIPIDEELQVLQRYYKLQQQRFGDNLMLDIQLPQRPDCMVPPLTLQLLVENAIKHNIVSKARPLTIQLFADHNMLVVRNNLQLKQEAEASTRVGLSNIVKRYQLLSKEPVRIESDKDSFTVRLPIIIQSI